MVKSYFEWRTRTEVLAASDLSLQRRVYITGRRSSWSPSERWFVRKTLEDKFDCIESSTIAETVEPLILKEYEDIKKIDDEIFSIIERFIETQISAPSLYSN